MTVPGGRDVAIHVGIDVRGAILDWNAGENADFHSNKTCKTKNATTKKKAKLFCV